MRFPPLFMERTNNIPKYFTFPKRGRIDKPF